KGQKQAVPVAIRGRNVVVPATSSFPTTFGLSGRSLEIGHYGKKQGDAVRLQLVHRYAREALRNRISLHTMSMLPPGVSRENGKIQVDFTAWDTEISPYLDGKALPSGAKYTSIDLRTPPDLTPVERNEYLKQVEAHFRQRGWLERLFS